MAEFWWRSWHGAPMDHKWSVIATRTGVKAGIVSAIAWALLDHASQNDDRGRVDDFDIETYAVFSGFAEDDISSVIQAMTDKGIIVDGRLAKWDKRQPKSESEIERVRQYRKKKDSVPERNEPEQNSKENPVTDNYEKLQNVTKNYTDTDTDTEDVTNVTSLINREPAKKPPVAECENPPKPPKPVKPQKHKYGPYQNVLLLDADLDSLKSMYPDSWEEKIKNLSDGKEMKGYKYKNDYLAILNWAKRDPPNRQVVNAPFSQPAKRSFVEVIEERNRLKNDQQRNSHDF